VSFLRTVRSSRTRKLLGSAAGLIGLWAVVGFLLLPPLLRPVVERKLAENLHRPVKVRRLALNPFALSATLEGLDVKDRDGTRAFLAFERLYVNLESSSLFRRGLVVREVLLEKPSLTLVRRDDGTYSVSDLLEAKAGAKEPGENEAPARFSVNNIRVEGGAVEFDDRPKGKVHTVRDVRIGIPFLSNIPSQVEITTQPVFEAKVNGASFVLHGWTKPFSGTRETTLDLRLSDVDLPHYLAYLPSPIAPTVNSARLDTQIGIAFTQPTEGRPALVLSGTTSVRNLAIEYGGRSLLGWERLDVTVDSLDVFGRKARIRSLKVTRPEVWIWREKMGDHNIANALAAPGASGAGAARVEAAKDEAKEAAAGAPFLVEIAETGFAGGTIHYDNLAFSQPFHAVLGDVSLTAKGLSTAAGAKASVEASARSDAGETLKNKGTLSMEPFVLEGELGFGGIPLKRYATFLERIARMEIDDGVLDLRTAYRFSTGSDANTTLSGLAVTLTSPRLRKRGERTPFFSAPSVAATGISVDVARHAFALGELSSAKGTLAVAREADGSVDLAKVLVPAPADAPPSPEWSVTASRVAIDDYTVKVEDRGLANPARFALTKTDVGLANFSTARGSKAALSVELGVDGKGKATVKGPLGVDPVLADLAIDVRSLDLVPFEPYLMSGMKLTLARGTLSGSGRLALRQNAKGDAVVAYTGHGLVSNVLTLDPETNLEVLKWETLSAEGLKVATNPLSLELAKVAVSAPACDVVIEADGTVNLRKAIGASSTPEGGEEPAEPDAGSGETAASDRVRAISAVEQAAAPSAAPAPAPAPAGDERVMPIRIDALTVQGGRVGVTDRFVKPSYSATWTDLGGSVTGLSSESGTVARLDLRGSLAGHSPLQITGSVNPLAAAAFADIKASFRDIDLPPFTPYAGRYAGYTIARGTLTMEVSYKLQDRRLEAQNRFLVDQFELGEKVESKDAVKLPVKLAVSLLKDENGLIDLDLPVEGSLDDPKFRISKVIWRVLRNLIAKAATSPFALLGKAFGGKGEELSTVDFADGRDTLDEAATKKLDALAKALLDRPALRLEATGRFSGEKDMEGLRRLRFDRKVKAQKVADLAKGSEAPAGIDAVVVEGKEYEGWLKRAYRQEKFPKPRNSLGIAKDLPVSEMENLMLAGIPVTSDDLRRLALARANAVKDYLVGAGKVDGARILVLEPGDKPSEPKEKARASRVDFSLK
jgi:hypothetical protein